jgi:predicted RecB family nuclease
VSSTPPMHLAYRSVGTALLRLAVAKFIEATESFGEAKRRELMDEILAYDREDHEATWAVFEWVRSKFPSTILAHRL